MSISKKAEPIKIAILAVGGDGGSVLTNWVIDTAESNGYWAQSTSIAGVAQRTGATVYYIELIDKKSLVQEDGSTKTPVLAQMPAPYDVDIVLATEIMEAGRALFRNFVSDKTTLIYSTNRNLAIQEKETPGDGIRDGKKINELAKKLAKKSLFGNLKIIADKNKSVISASMFGALAASSALPFAKEDFLKTIEKGGFAVAASLSTFNESYDYIEHFEKNSSKYKPALTKAALTPIPESIQNKKLSATADRIKSEFPKKLHAVLYTGVLHLADWQNDRWANEYLDKIKPILEKDNAVKQYALTKLVAQYLATGMAYDDLIFVSDQKTRTERYSEVYKQIEADKSEIVHTLDYLHPGFDELVGFLPSKMGQRVSQSEKWQAFYTKRLDRDRRMKSTGLFNFLMLYTIGGMKKWRMKTFRHFAEMENINGWLDRIIEVVAHNYPLAVLIAKSYRLKKGYGDTYHRGHSKFRAVNDFAMAHQQNEKAEEYVEHLMQCALQAYDTESLQKQIDDLKGSL